MVWKKLPFWLFAALLTSAVTASIVHAEEPGPVPGPGIVSVMESPEALPVDKADTAWIMVSAALVFFMLPGLAFFYGGLVRKKNILSILMQCFMAAGLITIQWVIIGYSLSFGPDVGGFIGSLKWLALKGVGLSPSPDYASTVPHQAFMIYQAMFAIITPALILGAFAERMKFSTFCVFIVLWATFVYNPVCHWVWGGGFLGKMGALDFAGGAVVHINAGVAALVTALMLGKRKGYPHRMSPPHNLPFAVLGAGILWLGWFGFNAGSALESGAVAVNAFVVTHVAAASAGLAWALLDWLFNSKPTLLGMITGVVGGLVAITPAAGFVDVSGAIWIGLGCSVICYISVTLIKTKLGYDDSLDAFGVHGVGGMWGALATGIWATTAVNAGGANGLLHGNPVLLWIQIKTVIITVVYSLVITFVLLKVLDWVMGLRVTDHEERMGLDLSEHCEAGYTVLD